VAVVTPRDRIGLALAASLLAATPALAWPGAGTGPWLAVGLASGSTRFDSHLRDFQWDLAPRAAWGASVTAGLGPADVSLRAWSSAASQVLGASVTPASAAVHVHTYDVAGELAIARAAGVTLLGRATAGRVVLSYAPDQAAVDTGTGTTTVGLAPVHAWSAGGGLALRRPLPGGFAVALAAERAGFSMDTAHRAGATIVTARDAFANWSGRLELTRVFALHEKGFAR
jgi:hypothetical protein